MKRFIISIFLLFSIGSYSQFNQYVPQLPTNAMVNVGIYKQRIYDQRKDWIQGRVNNLIGIIKSLITENNFPNEDINYHRNIMVGKISNYTKTIGYTDFSDDYEFQIIQENFNNIENYYYKYYNQLNEQKASEVGKIGIRMEKVDSYVQITEIIYGGAVWKSNQFEVGDKIIKVAQGENSLINVDGMSSSDVRELITGTKGTMVRLTILKRDFTYKTISLYRE